MIYPPVDCPKSIAHLISFNDLKNDDRAIVRGNWEMMLIILLLNKLLWK
jgi:hypothetical protein